MPLPLVRGAEPTGHTQTERFATRDRITLSLPAVSAAQAALFLLRGEAKHRVWSEMLAAPLDVQRWPAQQVLAMGRTTLLYGAY